MRVKLRREIDVDKPINIRELPPLQKVYVGFVTWLHSSAYYQQDVAKQLELEYQKQVQRDEYLKDLILAQLYKELHRNETLQKQETRCTEMILTINSKYWESLERVLQQKDLKQYDLCRVEEDADVRRAFATMPILLLATKKEL